MQVSLMIAFAIRVCHLVHSIPDCPSLKSNNPPPLRDLGKRDTSLHGQRFHVSSVTILPFLRSSRRRHVCVCVCFQDIHKINTSRHAKGSNSPTRLRTSSRGRSTRARGRNAATLSRLAPRPPASKGTCPVRIRC